MRNAPKYLPPENHVDPGQNQRQLGVRQLPHALGQNAPIECNNQRNVGNRVFRQAGDPGGQGYVARGALAQLRLPVKGTHTTVAI
jgi:hypothetical protein